ncbi:MAG: arginine--tRNA ligase [Gaiellales bacterium]
MIDPVSDLHAAIAGAVAGMTGGEVPELALERPANAEHGDYATSVAMRLAPVLGRAPREIAEELGGALAGLDGVDSVEVAGPGFLNLRLSADWYRTALRLMLEAGDDFGRRPHAPGVETLVEFVSANPTGDLTIGSARNAAYGDSVARLLDFGGEHVTREYYFNDAGNQVTLFGESVRARRRGEEIPEGGYPGEEVAEIASVLALADDAPLADWVEQGTATMMGRIRGSLERMRVTFDLWTSERTLHDSGAVGSAIERARAEGHIFEQDGATWLRTTDFGDDKDRVLLKADGDTTYFAADLAYIDLKFSRGATHAIYVLGADHHGYVQRLKAAAACLGYDPGRVEILIYQLVNVKGERMGKRRGNVITLNGLADAIGVDAARYFLVQRSHDQMLDIDLDLAVETSSKNPVYYVQYAHARCASILRKAADDGVAIEGVGTAHVPEAPEAALVRRLAEWPEVVAAAAELRAPHRIVAWIHDLAADFHAFHHDLYVLHEDDDVRAFRLSAVRATRDAIARALDLIGVSAPHRM